MSRGLPREVPRLALNQKEAAESLGMSVDHFERHVKGELPVIYSGSLRLYPLSALQRWLAEHTLHGGRRVA
jgi:excisionase family DNA binding protein